MVWYSHLFKNFPQFIVIHTVKGFGIVNKAEIDVFLELSCFFADPADVGNLISGSSAFSKISLNIWKFTVHVLTPLLTTPPHPLPLRHTMGLKNLPVLVPVPLSFLSSTPPLAPASDPWISLNTQACFCLRAFALTTSSAWSSFFPRWAVSLLLLQLFAQMSPFWLRSILTLCLILKTHQHLLSLALIVATGHNLYFVCLL